MNLQFAYVLPLRKDDIMAIVGRMRVSFPFPMSWARTREDSPQAW